MFAKSFSKAKAFYLRNQGHIHRFGDDLIYYSRVGLKTYILIKFWKWLEFEFPFTNLTTPAWV